MNLEPTSFEAAAAYLDDDNSSFYSDTEDEPNDEEDDALDDSDSDEGSAQLTNRIANDSEFKRQLLQQLLKFEQSLSVQPETTAKAVDQPFNEQKRNFCINELINSESNYVLNLHRVCIYFEQPLRCSRLVSRSMLDATFTPLNQLYRLQHSFEQQLQSAGSNFSSTKTLGQVLCEFFENGDLSMVYMAFCSKQLKVFHYLASQRLIKSELSVLLSNCEQRFAIDVARTQSQAHCSPIPLHGHLLQPMQRITRYPLLLRDILNHTPLQHSDKVLLQRALDKAEQLCNQVNDHCRKLESEKRLDWMQRHVHTFGLEYVLQFNTETRLMGDRALLQAGILIKITTKRKLMAFLCNDMLVLTIPLSSIGRPTELSQSDRALRGKYRLYRKPYLLHELTIVSESSALNEQLGDRITQLNGFVLGIKSSGKMLMLQSPRINVTKLWAKNLHQAIQKAKVANQLSLNVKHEEAPLLQSFDASMPISGQMTLILLECNNMISTNLMLSMYCVISFGVGTDPTVHSQTTRTALIRQLPTVASVRSRLSWSGNEKLSSSIRIKNLFQKRSSLHEAAEDNNPNCSDKKRLTPKILPEFVKTNQQVGASSWSSPSASSRTYSATINFMTTFLLPRADLTKHHLVMTFYEQSPYRPDHLFAQTAVPLLYLKQQTAPPLPVSVFDEPLTLKTHKRTGQIPNIRFKVQFKKQN